MKIRLILTKSFIDVELHEENDDIFRIIQISMNIALWEFLWKEDLKLLVSEFNKV